MILWAPLPKSRETISSCETLERHSHPKCRVLPLHCQEAPNSPPYRTMLYKDDSNYTSIAQIIGDTHRGKTNYFLKLYLNFIPLQAMGRFHVGCSRVQLVSPCLIVVGQLRSKGRDPWICKFNKYRVLLKISAPPQNIQFCFGKKNYGFGASLKKVFIIIARWGPWPQILQSLSPTNPFTAEAGSANAIWDLVDEIHTSKCHHHL